MEQRRVVETPAGEISYILVQKRVKNWNLRLRDGEEVILSVPNRCTAAQADAFIREKSGWIAGHLKRRAQEKQPLLPERSRAECAVVLQQAVDRVYPCVSPLGVKKPVLKIRKMRSQWGNCHWMQGYITLNTALHRCPEHLRDYVALHELVHFLHHDHGPGFYGMMDGLMPDWRERRRELKGYTAAIQT